MNYWKNKEERAKKASEHTVMMAAQYMNEIKKATNDTVIYGYDRYPQEIPSSDKPKVTVTAHDSVSAIMHFAKGKTAVLNFASYKNPGGMFLKGSSAQEESLCHESFLYNVLANFTGTYYARNQKALHKALYTDKALYTPNVIFEHNGDFQTCDVITCAAPNLTAARKYANVSLDENKFALAKRIKFIKDIAQEQQVETLILGAYGCGVFGQDPVETAMLFNAIFDTTTVNHIVYAIPAGKNLDAFIHVMKPT